MLNPQRLQNRANSAGVANFVVNLLILWFTVEIVQINRRNAYNSAQTVHILQEINSKMKG